MQTHRVSLSWIILDIAAFECLESAKRSKRAVSTLMRPPSNCLYVSCFSRRKCAKSLVELWLADVSRASSGKYQRTHRHSHLSKEMHFWLNLMRVTPSRIKITRPFVLDSHSFVPQGIHNKHTVTLRIYASKKDTWAACIIRSRDLKCWSDNAANRKTWRVDPVDSYFIINTTLNYDSHARSFPTWIFQGTPFEINKSFYLLLGKISPTILGKEILGGVYVAWIIFFFEFILLSNKIKIVSLPCSLRVLKIL